MATRHSRRASGVAVGTLCIAVTAAICSLLSDIILAEDVPPLAAIDSPAPEAPSGAPNVLLVLLDDVGFAAASTFGGPVSTPNYETLAAQGLRYNRFHTTAMCSPTRAALLTGRNHHRVEMGSIVNLAYGEPGYTSVIPRSAATIGRVLQLNGYSTAWLGKNHVTPDWEITPAGPYDRWPTGLGFDYYYGFMGGASDQFAPDLVENTTPVDPPTDADYILDKDLADHAIAWLREQSAAAPDKPVFLYLAPGTAHVPLQAPKSWIEKFRGRFDMGWDELRQQNFERQKRLGVIPADAVLTPRPESIPAWNSLSQQEKEVASRLMEVFAAQLAYFDDQFGRITSELKRLGKWDNTLVIYIDGDNGPSVESGLYGIMIEGLNGAFASVDYMHGHLDEMGGPRTFNGYPVGWAWATASPFQYAKSIASHLGGTRDGLVVSWPERISDKGELRQQFLHVTDIAPTIYDAIGIVPPREVDGVAQMSFDGVSFADTFDSAETASKHTSQYFEMLGNRAWYEDGWMASTTPGSTPWDPRPAAPESFGWELYDIDNDFSQSRNLAASNPGKLEEMVSRFREAADENSVWPLNNNGPARIGNSSLRPYLTNGRRNFEYFRTLRRLPNPAFPDIRNRAWSMRIEFEMPESDSSGVLITQGGHDAGWGAFLFGGIPTFIYKLNSLPGQQWMLASDRPLTPGRHDLTLRIEPDSGEPGAGATVSMSLDGLSTISTHLDATAPRHWPNEGVGIGRDFISTLTTDYSIPFEFPGEIESVKIDLDD